MLLRLLLFIHTKKKKNPNVYFALGLDMATALYLVLAMAIGCCFITFINWMMSILFDYIGNKGDRGVETR